MQRYQSALGRFGFERIRQVYEPVAAAFFYAQTLEQSATVLVADFGGGTTDFSVIAFEKARARPAGERARARRRGRGGRPLRLPHHRPGGAARASARARATAASARSLELPRSCFASFANWHELSVMKASRDFRDFKELSAFSESPELVGRFIRLIESEQGYTLYKSVSDTQGGALPRRGRALRFPRPGLRDPRDGDARAVRELDRPGARGDRGDPRAGARRRFDLPARRGPRVPHRRQLVRAAVRRIFEQRFGAARVEAGNEFVSIANGLATIGLREDLDAWTVTL
jgi:hypothetical chaperone protein